MSQIAPRDLEDLRRRIAHAQRWVVLSGAGMSAESGIPMFRDAQSGLWAHFDPMELASQEGFAAHPGRVWGWYAERREGVRRAQPNAGHRVLAEYAQRWPERLSIVTQNVDDLHQRAGSPGVIRLHGDILQDRWFSPCPHPVDGRACQTAQAVPGEPGQPPGCARCGNLLRPGVVWFGEALPALAWRAAQDAVAQADVLVVVGTSGAVWPAAGLAAQAREQGAFVAILNPDVSEIDDQAHLCLAGTAAQVLPELLGPLL